MSIFSFLLFYVFRNIVLLTSYKEVLGIMTLNERIKFLRKTLGLNQTNFGEKIGIKVSQASFIEKPNNPVTQRIIQLICTAFNVSEEWLTAGKGDMFRPAIEPCIMDRLQQELNLTPEEIDVVRTFIRLTPEQRKIAIEFVRDFASKFSDVINAFKEGTKKDVSDSDTSNNHAKGNASIPHALHSPAAPSDADRPAGLSDEEWQLIQMSREEKEQASQTLSYTNSAIG